MVLTADCLCGGSREAHGHHRSGSDCSHCDGCGRFRSHLWRRLAQGVLLAGCAAALAFVFLAGQGS